MARCMSVRAAAAVLAIAPDDLPALTPAILKAAYIRQARATHPDKTSTASAAADTTATFQNVQAAQERLDVWLTDGQPDNDEEEGETVDDVEEEDEEEGEDEKLFADLMSAAFRALLPVFMRSVSQAPRQ